VSCIHVNLPLLEHFQRKLDLLKRSRLKRHPETEVNKPHEHYFVKVTQQFNSLLFLIDYILINPLISQCDQHLFSLYASVNSSSAHPLLWPTLSISNCFQKNGKFPRVEQISGSNAPGWEQKRRLLSQLPDWQIRRIKTIGKFSLLPIALQLFSSKHCLHAAQAERTVTPRMI